MLKGNAWWVTCRRPAACVQKRSWLDSILRLRSWDETSSPYNHRVAIAPDKSGSSTTQYDGKLDAFT